MEGICREVLPAVGQQLVVLQEAFPLGDDLGAIRTVLRRNTAAERQPADGPLAPGPAPEERQCGGLPAHSP